MSKMDGKEKEEQKVNMTKHKNKFIVVLKELLKKFKKDKPVENYLVCEQQERQNKNGNTSVTSQTDAKNKSENISRDKEKEALVEKPCSSYSSQSDMSRVDINKNEEAESVSGQILADKQPNNDFSTKTNSTDDIHTSGAETLTSQGTECKGIFITELSPTTKADDTLIYFQSKKASGGGDAEVEMFDEERLCAVLSFDESEDCKSVICREHHLLGKKVSVEKYQSQTFPLSLEELSPTAIDEALPGLGEILMEEKAFFRKHETERALVVVCLEDEYRKVLTIVTEYLDSIKEKEIRKTYQTKLVEDIDQKRMQLLEQIGFVNSIQHPKLDVNLDIKQRELHLTGPDEQVSDALKKYSEITEKLLELPTNAARIMNELWKNQFCKTLKDEGINGTIYFDEANRNSIKIIALTSVDCDRLFHFFCESIKVVNLSFLEENAIVVESEKFQNFCSKLKDDKHLEIEVDMSKGTIRFYGAPEVVASAKEKIQHFIETEQISNESRKVSGNEIKLLAGHLSCKVKEIEESLKKHKVAIVIHQESREVKMEGTREGLVKCNELVTELLSAIVEKREEFSSPGLGKLLLGAEGQEQLKLIEVEKKVDISVEKCAKQTSTQNPLPQRVRIWEKQGSIEKERADILVNFAHTDLNNPTECGKRLYGVGGPAFVEACEVYTNIPVGDIVCTTGGNLSCHFVIHAVCCDWDKTDKTKETYRTVLKKILDKSNELKVCSVAMPTIGTELQFLQKMVFFEILKKEVEKMNSSNSSQISLKEIRVINSEEEKRPKSRRFSAASQIFSSLRWSSLPQNKRPRPIGRPPLLSFGSIIIYLSEGDVTEHIADATVNLLHQDGQLANGGAVSRSILRSGGQEIQKELNSQALLKDSIIVTSSGSMKNVKNILHFIPTSTDIPAIEALIEGCLHEAKRLSLDRVSIPAIGTAKLKINPKSSAGLILNAAERFSKTNNTLEIDIVVFQKNMVQDFKTALEERAKANLEGSELRFRSTSVSTNQSSQYPSSGDKLTIEEGNDMFQLLFVASSSKHIDESIEKVNKFIERNSARNEIKHRDIYEKVKNRLPEVKVLVRKHNVLIESSSSDVVSVKGLKGDVSECVSSLKNMFADPIADIPLPADWDTQPPDQKVHLVALQATSSEYQDVLSHFISKRGAFDLITAIERIQNPDWYKAYLIKKKSMNGEENEMKLFHGTASRNTAFINENNFNRSLAGIHGTVYGEGVYFARDASYSLGYSSTDRTGLCKMYVVKVLVGQFTIGSQGMKAPPSRNDPKNPGLLYDSVVDKIDNPSIFVIFLDHQCYPEYLITFKPIKK